MKKIFLLIAFFLISISCGNPETEQITTVDSTTVGSSNITMIVVDTIGVDIGDTNYVFGQIDQVLFNSDGNILVLDSSKHLISVFSSQGDFLRSIGRQGSGPGEFQRPVSMTFLGNGNLAVADPWSGSIKIFNTDMQYETEITGFFPVPPLVIQGADGNAIIGLMRVVDTDNSLIGYSLARLEGDPEPVFIYVEEMVPFDPSMIGPGYIESTVDFASDHQGRVFISVKSTDSYRVDGYLPDGERFLSIEQPFEPVPKTQEEIDMEIEDFNDFLQRMSSSGGGRGHSALRNLNISEIKHEPIPYRYSIADLAIDGQDRIWVRRGSEIHPCFDVYDLEGELLLEVSVETEDPEADRWEIVITDQGILAYTDDPVDYPRILLFETVE